MDRPFHRAIKNGIDYNYTTFKYFNFVRQKVNGLELEVSAKPAATLTIGANYTLITGDEQLQNRKTNINDTMYQYFLRRPKHSINLNIGYQLTKSLFVCISARSVSTRYDFGGYKKEDVLLESYFLLNAHAEYKWKPAVKFFLDGQNLANKKFFDIRGFTAIPFLVSGGVTFEL